MTRRNSCRPVIFSRTPRAPTSATSCSTHTFTSATNYLSPQGAEASDDPAGFRARATKLPYESAYKLACFPAVQNVRNWPIVLQKSKVAGSLIFREKTKRIQSPIRIAAIALPKSPVSLTRDDEVPRILAPKSRLRPAEFLITAAKRLLQHYRPIALLVAESKFGRDLVDSRHESDRANWLLLTRS
jgi:hypothetical protein